MNWNKTGKKKDLPKATRYDNRWGLEPELVLRAPDNKLVRDLVAFKSAISYLDKVFETELAKYDPPYSYDDAMAVYRIIRIEASRLDDMEANTQGGRMMQAYVVNIAMDTDIVFSKDERGFLVAGNFRGFINWHTMKAFILLTQSNKTAYDIRHAKSADDVKNLFDNKLSVRWDKPRYLKISEISWESIFTVLSKKRYDI